MALDPTQVMLDAQCILTCVPQGMLPALQLAAMMDPSVVVTTQVAMVTNTNVLLLSANLKRRKAIIQSPTGSAMLIGPIDMTAATGFQLPASAGSPPNAQLEVFTQGELYARGTTGGTASVIEFLTP